jgi:hypothetical protein
MAKRKFVLRLHIHDAIMSTAGMSREQKGLYLEFVLRYADGIEIPASAERAAGYAKGASLEDIKAVLDEFKSAPHERLEDQEEIGDRIYDERIEPLYLSNRGWRY